MLFQQDVDLQPYNTFGISVQSKYFAAFTSLEMLSEIAEDHIYESNNKLVLGGGSNVLFKGNFDGLVLKNSLKGIDIIEENEESILLEVQAGEVWHELVLYCVANNYAGIENLSLIPGLMGAAPMQNIGAYGVELINVFDSLQAFHRKDHEVHTFQKEDCQFGYRESIFKRSLKDQYIITSVRLRLSKKPNFNVSYGAIQQTLEEMGIHELSIKAISDAVINIRSGKLPDPKELGNAGSFFKNPVISNSQFEPLQQEYPKIPHYPAGEGQTKVPAGWLIEQCGWKGKVVGNTGAHKHQALVLVNYGNASGEEVYKLALEIKDSVMDKFGIEINPEVNVI